MLQEQSSVLAHVPDSVGFVTPRTSCFKMGEYEYDLVTIGAGSGGTRASRMAAQNHKAKVATIEFPFDFIASDTKGGAGGTCVIRGCVPKKLLVYGSMFTEDFRDSKGFGWSSEERPPFSWKELLHKKNAEIFRLNGVYNRLLHNAGVELIEGRGKLLDRHTVEVELSSGGTRKLTAKTILIATGGKPVKAPIPGKEYAITSDDALVLDDLPDAPILIVGAGYIALEFAGIFNGMGAEVHLVYRKDYPLAGFDYECRVQVAENLEKRGVHVHPETSPTKIEKNEDGSYTVHLKRGSEETAIRAALVMFGTGRKPNSRDIGLEAVGVEIDEKDSIVVDEYSRTSVDNIYAIGDVTNRMALTPVALMEGMAFVSTVFNDTPTKPIYSKVATACFVQPPLCYVGLTEEEAKQRLDGDIDVFVSKFKPMKNTLSGRDEKTLMKLIVHVPTNEVVGAHMVGPDAPEILQGLAIAIKAGAKKADFDATVGIHPTAAEEFVTMRSRTRRIRGEGGRNSS